MEVLLPSDVHEARGLVDGDIKTLGLDDDQVKLLILRVVVGEHVGEVEVQVRPVLFEGDLGGSTLLDVWG